MMIDLLEIDDFLDGQACDALRAELRAAGGGPATVLSAECCRHGAQLRCAA